MPCMKRELYSRHSDGKAGELRVASELIRRGVVVALPMIDLGYDLLLESGVRIQVKTCHRRPLGHGKLLNYFLLPSVRRVANTQSYKNLYDRKPSDEYDFCVAWGVDEDRFWVIPASLLDGKRSVSLGPECCFKDANLEQMNELRSQGKTYDQIAALTGFSQCKVWSVMKGKRSGDSRYPDTQKLRDCEDRWDYIVDHLALLGVKSFEQETVATTP